MTKGIYTNGKNFRWIQRTRFSNQNRIAVVIPQFNEPIDNHFQNRLNYYSDLADVYQNTLEIILVDDGSTNGSLEQIEQYFNSRDTLLSAAAIDQNTNKVGALALTANAINNDFILFSDFDTDLHGLDRLPCLCDKIMSEPGVMGCYFKMQPFESSNLITKYQTIEYSLLRTWYQFHQSDKSANVMPGAGSLFKNLIIREIFASHSGHRNGEDRESTIIGQRLGYRSVYNDEILISTRTPTTVTALINQRIRWNLGYLETLYFEQHYYTVNIRERKKLGARVILDFANILFLLVLTLSLPILLVIHTKYALAILGFSLFIKYLWIFLLTIGNSEMRSQWQKILPTLLMYPFLKVFVEVPSWILAIKKFSVFLRSKDRLNKDLESRQEIRDTSSHLPSQNQFVSP